MKILITLAVFFVSTTGFGACKDFSGRYGWNLDGDIPVTLEIVQTGCEHMVTVVDAPTVKFKETKTINFDGVLATIIDDDYERLDAIYKFQGDAIIYTENNFPKDGTHPYVDEGTFFFTDNKTLTNNIQRVQDQVHSTFSFIYVRL